MSERAEASGTAFWGGADETEALRRYRTLVNTIDDGIYQLDAEGRFVAVNDAIVELTGYERTELLGESISPLLVEDSSTAKHRLSNPIDRSEQLEFTLQTAEGERVRCEVHVNLLDADGTTGIVRDITDRKRREQERQRVIEALEAAREASACSTTTASSFT